MISFLYMMASQKDNEKALRGKQNEALFFPGKANYPEKLALPGIFLRLMDDIGNLLINLGIH